MPTPDSLPPGFELAPDAKLKTMQIKIDDANRVLGELQMLLDVLEGRAMTSRSPALAEGLGNVQVHINTAEIAIGLCMEYLTGIELDKSIEESAKERVSSQVQDILTKHNELMDRIVGNDTFASIES